MDFNKNYDYLIDMKLCENIIQTALEEKILEDRVREEKYDKLVSRCYKIGLDHLSKSGKYRFRIGDVLTLGGRDLIILSNLLKKLFENSGFKVVESYCDDRFFGIDVQVL